MGNINKSHIDQEKELQNSSKIIYTLLLKVRVSIGNLFLHSEGRKSMRKRQLDRAKLQINKSCLDITKLIHENRDTQSLKELISKVIELILISRGVHDISIQKYDMIINKITQQGSKAEILSISELLILFGMKEDVIESYLRAAKHIK